MAILVRVFLIETLNDWDDTALHNYLHDSLTQRPSLQV